MNFRVLGCSGGVGQGKHTTSFLLEDSILIDAGTGACDMPAQQMATLKHVVLSHSHLDHCAALPLLVDTLFNQFKEQGPLQIHGHAETLDALKQHIFNNKIWPDFSRLPSATKPVMQFVPFHSSGPDAPIGAHIDNIAFTAIPVNHTIPSHALYMSNGQHRICFSSDTGSNDALWQYINTQPPLDLLVVECGFPNSAHVLAKTAGHYCPETLLADLEKLQHKPIIAITHLHPKAEQETWLALNHSGKFRFTRLARGNLFSFP